MSCVCASSGIFSDKSRELLKRLKTPCHKAVQIKTKSETFPKKCRLFLYRTLPVKEDSYWDTETVPEGAGHAGYGNFGFVLESR